jgi:hypothetical protein
VAHMLETHRKIEMGGHGTSSSQSRFGAVWFTPFLSA